MNKTNLPNLRLSILMPVYNGADFLGETLKSVLSQGFRNYELIIVDDCSTDNTNAVIKAFKDKRIKYYKNQKNLGYPKNLAKCFQKSTGEIIMLMAQDDILAKNTLLKTCQVFTQSPLIGAITRPYFWFDKTFSQPVRAKEQLNPNKDEVVTINDNFETIVKVFKTLDQLSGLAFRKKYFDIPFSHDIFTCHVYPFISIFKKHPLVFLKDYTVAVRIRSSQTRLLSTIYDKSPLQSWVDLFNNTFPEKKFKKLKNYCLKNFVANNYVGLVQIKNYSTYKNLLREIWFLVKYNPKNILRPDFWVFSLGSILIPGKILRWLADNYKNHVLALSLKNIKINLDENRKIS